MPKFYGDSLLANTPADIKEISADGSVIYSASFDRSKADREQDLYAQKIWKITKTVIEGAEGEKQTITTLYPEGSKNSTFAWAERDSLTYDFC